MKVTDEAVENAVTLFTGDEEWKEQPLLGRLAVLGAMRRVLEQFAASAPAVSGEWVMVPREPTEAMIAAAEKAWMNRNLRDPASEPIPDSYRAMLASAPSAVEDAESLLSDVVDAWEALPGGNHPPRRVARWLLQDMSPVINAIRARKP